MKVNLNRRLSNLLYILSLLTSLPLHSRPKFHLRTVKLNMLVHFYLFFDLLERNFKIIKK